MKVEGGVVEELGECRVERKRRGNGEMEKWKGRNLSARGSERGCELRTIQQQTEPSEEHNTELE